LFAICTIGIPFLTAAAQPQVVARPDQTTIASAQIDTAITKLMEAAHATGAGIAIFHNGKVAYLKAYGCRDVEKGYHSRQTP
jgi:CubicO group peptidase (beta-lactamase class C family)